MASTKPDGTVGFGPFVVDLQTGELRKKGLKVRLQDKSFQILAALLEHPGELVAREELRERLWPGNTFVDWDNGLNTALAKLREALGDSAENPRYIETMPKRGYRFVAPSSQDSATRTIMLAILPFENLSGDPEQEYFSDGLTEEMITRAAQLSPERLGVIARTSSMRYKRSKKGIDAIARELNVDWILEGSVRPGTERVRITAQLIRTQDQTHLWAQTYDRDLQDILVVQTEVALAIADEIHLKLEPKTKAKQARQVNREAHHDYLMGSYHLAKFTGEGITRAIHYLLRSIEVDPDYAPAHEVLAFSYFMASGWTLAPREALEKARAAARRALEIDESLAEAHASLGIVLLHDWDWTAAEKEFKKAIELNAGSVKSHQFYGWHLAAMERFDEAVEEVRHALELDPVSPETNTFLGHVLYLARRYDQAIEQLNKTVALDGGYWFAHLVLGLAYQHTGRLPDAIAAFEKARQADRKSPEPIGALGQAYAASGDKERAIHVLHELKEWSEHDYGSSFHMGRIYAALGDKDQAFTWFDKAYQERSFFLTWFKVEPEFDPLRSDPRFSQVLRLLSFPAPADKAFSP